MRRFGERRVLLVGLACGAVGFLRLRSCADGLLFLAAVPVVALWGLASPAAQGIMSRQIDASEQGALQGATGA